MKVSRTSSREVHTPLKQRIDMRVEAAQKRANELQKRDRNFWKMFNYTQAAQESREKLLYKLCEKEEEEVHRSQGESLSEERCNQYKEAREGLIVLQSGGHKQFKKLGAAFREKVASLRNLPDDATPRHVFSEVLHKNLEVKRVSEEHATKGQRGLFAKEGKGIAVKYGEIMTIYGGTCTTYNPRAECFFLGNPESKKRADLAINKTRRDLDIHNNDITGSDLDHYMCSGRGSKVLGCVTSAFVISGYNCLNESAANAINAHSSLGAVSNEKKREPNTLFIPCLYQLNPIILAVSLGIKASEEALTDYTASYWDLWKPNHYDRKIKKEPEDNEEVAGVGISPRVGRKRAASSGIEPSEERKEQIRTQFQIDYKGRYTTVAATPCPLCTDKIFSRADTLGKHLTIAHGIGDYKTFPCPMSGCKIVCRRGSALKAHLDAHLGIKPYKCRICDHTFTQASNCKTHEKKMHGQYGYDKTTQVTCEECGKCVPEYSLKTHVDRHRKQKISCTLCSKAFLKVDLLKHIRRIHEKHTLPCGHCTRSFTTAATLSKHEKEHDEGRLTECGQCNGFFLEIKKHIDRIHENKRHIACPSCLKTFQSSHHFTQHQRTKKNSACKEHKYIPLELPYRCGTCDQTFGSQNLDQAIVHMQEKHERILQLSDLVANLPSEGRLARQIN